MDSSTLRMASFLCFVSLAAAAGGCASSSPTEPQFSVKVDGEPAKLYDFDAAPQPIPVDATNTRYICPPRPDGPEVMDGKQKISASDSKGSQAVAVSETRVTTTAPPRSGDGQPRTRVLTVGHSGATAQAATDDGIFGDPGQQSPRRATPALAVRTNSPASVREPAAPTRSVNAPARAATTYTVRRGDTLWSIAQRHYGNGHRWSQIAEANSIQANQLAVGQRIYLP